MKLDGVFAFSGPRQRVWDLLQDPSVLAAALPGTERLELTAPDRLQGIMKVSVGPVTAARFDVTVVLADKQPPAHFAMQIDGKGSVGFTRGAATVDLAEAGGGTEMRYSSDVQVGGKIAAVGQRLLETVARTMMRQALDALERELRARLAADAERS